MNPRATAAVILAAGESRRMGTLKPLLPLGKRVVLERVAALFHDAGITDVRVVIGHRGEEIRHRLPSLKVKWIPNDRYHEGMLSSIKKGLRSLPSDRTVFFLLPVDIPLVRPRTIAALLEKWSGLENAASILYPSFQNERGHPPLISTRLVPEILKWDRQGGLNMFLASRETEARDLPVIDEYILKDMDTRSDYEHLTEARIRYDIPTAAECTAILNDPTYVSGATASHCRAVSELAVFLGRRLVSRNNTIRPARIAAAALLHDVAKGRPDHARKGAALLSGLGFSGIADIVERHMDIDFPDDAPLTDTEVVYLADKLVRGDKLVSLSARFGDKLARHGHDPESKKAILKRSADTLKIVRRLEKESGRQLQSLLGEFLRKTP